MAQVIAAATAIIALTVAVLYGLGAISLGLVLWYVQDPVSPALATLPREILVVQAFSGVIFPAAVVATVVLIFRELAASIWRWPVKRTRRNSLLDFLIDFVLISLLAAALALVPLAALRLNFTIPGVVRPFRQIYIACLIASVLSVYLAVHLIPDRLRKASRTDSHAQRVGHALVRAGLVFLAILPMVAFTAASIPLPVVDLCGTSFNHVDYYGRHYAVGNLIGVDGKYAYLAETKEVYVGKKVISVAYKGSYIAVMPVAEASLETIGRYAECNDMNPSPTGSPATGTAVETNAALAVDYAKDAVGACLNRQLGQNNNFIVYEGGGVVEFQTGTPSDPRGDPGRDTLIQVQTYADGYVADNSALDHWGCQPPNGMPWPGYYVNGGPARPHWFMQLAAGPGGAISGIIGYFEPNGQTGGAQTFTGHVDAGLATLTFSKAGFQTATYQGSSIVLGSCTTWLRNVPTVSDCRFAHTTSIR